MLAKREANPCSFDAKEVYATYMAGEMERGDGGVVFVPPREEGDGGGTTYVFPREFSNATFRESIQDTVDEAGREKICVVVSDGKAYHVIQIPRISFPPPLPFY